MKKFNFRVMAITLGLFVFFTILMAIKFYYFDIYLMSLNGRVKAIRINIKKAMYITVIDKECNLGHFWPVLQANVATGDSLYKISGQYDITLIKSQTGERIICHYEDYKESR